MVILAFAVTPRKRREDRERTAEILDRVDGWIAEACSAASSSTAPTTPWRRAWRSSTTSWSSGRSSLGARCTGCSSECCRPSAAVGGQRAVECDHAAVERAHPRAQPPALDARGRARASSCPAALRKLTFSMPAPSTRARHACRLSLSSGRAQQSSPAQSRSRASRLASSACTSVCAGSAWRLWSWNRSRSRSWSSRSPVVYSVRVAVGAQRVVSRLIQTGGTLHSRSRPHSSPGSSSSANSERPS